MKTTTAIILSSIAITGAGAYYFYQRQINLLKNSLTYKPIGFKIMDLSADKTSVLVKLRISSSSTLDADIKDVYVDLFLNDNYFGSVQNQGSVIIPAKGYSDIELMVTISPKSVIGDLLKLVTSIINTKDISIRINGFVKLKALFFFISTPFTYETTLKEIMGPVN